MTTLVLVLLFGLAGLLIALRALRILGGQRAPTLSDLELLWAEELDRYGHLPRVLGPQDFLFLAASRRGRDLVSVLRSRRVRVMGRYLRQMGVEFESLMALATMFAAAPTAQAENFARALFWQRCRFYTTFYHLRIRVWANRLLSWPCDLKPLEAEIGTLRREADRILRAMNPSDLGALRRFLRSAA